MMKFFAPPSFPLSSGRPNLFMSIMRSDEVKTGYARAPNRSLIRSLGIDESEMNQPFIGMIFNYGHFVFESAAQEHGLKSIRYVPNIERHDRTVQTIIARSGAKGEDRAGA
mgnify:CR=1 FL=1